jgi:hypothetical protein
MLNESTKSLCLMNILDGLAVGLTQFSGPSRAALIYAEKPHDPIRVFDPQHLLQGHEPKLKELYLDSDEWRQNTPYKTDLILPGQIHPEPNLELTGLISHGGRTRSVFYQMWFTEHHPDMCSIGPTERWLEHAVFLLSHDLAYEEAFYAGSSGYVLREYAAHAVRDYVLDEVNRMLGWDTKVQILPILDAILAISKMPEEGYWPRGDLSVVAPQDFSGLDFLIRFPHNERPSLGNVKHVRKLLLTVEFSDHKLICDGLNIVGIVTGKLPECRLTADFREGYGFLRLAGDLVCSFYDGRFHSSNRKANLVCLEEALLETPLDPSIGHILFKIASYIVNRAGEQKHGCTLVIDLNERPLEIAGQKMVYPIDLGDEQRMELATSLSKVDGALHIGSDGYLHGFACLLDGRNVPGENRARGARFNSALRFTAEHENLIVVVVSSDRPVSIIQGGVELTAQCEYKPLTKLMGPPPTLKQWIHHM